jgi:hypothetical protein
MGNSFSACSSEIEIVAHEKSYPQVSSISMQRQCNARQRVARMKFGKRKCLFPRCLDDPESLQISPPEQNIRAEDPRGKLSPPCLFCMCYFKIHACLDDCQVRQIRQHGPFAHARDADCLTWKFLLAKLTFLSIRSVITNDHLLSSVW